MADGWLAWRGVGLAREVLADVTAVHHECQALRARKAGPALPLLSTRMDEVVVFLAAEGLMPDQETWRFINTFAPWFSAAGTITAVIVSLYLARRSGRADVRVELGLVRVLSPGLLDQSEEARPEFLKIRAVNYGFRDVVIPGIVYWTVVGRSEGWVVLPPNNSHSTQTPARLQHGDDVVLLYPTERMQKMAAGLLSWVAGKWFPTFAIWRLRVVVHSSTGQRFGARLDRRMRKWLLEQARSTAPNPAPPLSPSA